ncbi:uncharacterized protein L201_001804 [Kwoniella dendrophila CBS 6074]|uniref:Uncharacterized protein n=1 Tax=Kwoniella dendrophila CBS 6074 TaxID=1295534 RepID=A0AAX4JQT2_9TREE
MSDVVKTGSEMMPTLKVAGALTVRALDTLPLPLLVVVFLACLALLQWPVTASPSILPTFTPPSIEKDRLSPLPIMENPSKGFFTFSPLPSAPMTAQFQLYASNPTVSVPLSSTTMQSSAVKQSNSSPNLGRNVRRGSKQLREWRLGLGVVGEEDETESGNDIGCIQIV